jgi:DNA-binding MarR family transcriptional regulator
MHHDPEKYRGASFPEILFGLRTITHQRLRDRKGRLIPTVVSYPMGEDAREEMAATARTQEDMLLLKLAEMPEASLAELAKALGWSMKDGSPYKQMVSRTFEKLERAKLVKKERGSYVLTPAGEKLVEKLKPAKPQQSED